MNYGAEPADQVVRYTLEGTEFALKISGTAAKNFAVFALAVLRDQKKTHGKTKLVRLLREGKPLKFFSVPTDQMRDFAKAAKSHGLLYVPIRDRSDPDNIEIAVWAEDAAKVNRVIDKLQLDVVDSTDLDNLHSNNNPLFQAESFVQGKAGARLSAAPALFLLMHKHSLCCQLMICFLLTFFAEIVPTK